jgi:hypothetical protein
MKNYLILIISISLFSCSKSSDSTTLANPFSISVNVSPSGTYLVKNTDIPLKLDSTVIRVDERDILGGKMAPYIESCTIPSGTTFQDLESKSFLINVPKDKYNPKETELLYGNYINTRLSTDRRSLPNIPQIRVLKGLIIRSGGLLSNWVSSTPGNPNSGVSGFLTPQYNKLYLKPTDFGTVGSGTNLLIIKKSSDITSVPTIKDYDGTIIPFSESNLNYYVYFNPIPFTNANDVQYAQNIITINGKSLDVLGGFDTSGTSPYFFYKGIFGQNNVSVINLILTKTTPTDTHPFNFPYTTSTLF